jgi:hypothetical protein
MIDVSEDIVDIPSDNKDWLKSISVFPIFHRFRSFYIFFPSTIII